MNLFMNRGNNFNDDVDDYFDDNYLLSFSVHLSTFFFPTLNGVKHK